MKDVEVHGENAKIPAEYWKWLIEAAIGEGFFDLKIKISLVGGRNLAKPILVPSQRGLEFLETPHSIFFKIPGLQKRFNLYEPIFGSLKFSTLT